MSIDETTAEQTATEATPETPVERSKRSENRYEPHTWGAEVYLTAQPRGSHRHPRIKAKVLDESLAGVGVRLSAADVAGQADLFEQGMMVRVDNGQFSICGHIMHRETESTGLRLGLQWLPNAEYEPYHSENVA